MPTADPAKPNARPFSWAQLIRLIILRIGAGSSYTPVLTHLGVPVGHIPPYSRATSINNLSFVCAISTLPKPLTPRSPKLLCSRGAHEATADILGSIFRATTLKKKSKTARPRSAFDSIHSDTIPIRRGEPGYRSPSCASAAARRRRPTRRGRGSWTKSSRPMRSACQRRSSYCCWVRLASIFPSLSLATATAMDDTNQPYFFCRRRRIGKIYSVETDEADLRNRLQQDREAGVEARCLQQHHSVLPHDTRCHDRVQHPLREPRERGPSCSPVLFGVPPPQIVATNKFTDPDANYRKTWNKY